MTLVVVERGFEEPTAFADVAALEEAVGWCLKQHQVEFLVSYFSADRRRMVCLYEAPDAEAVRRTQVQGKLPFEAIWSSSEPLGRGLLFAPGALETVVAERRFEPALRPGDLEGMMQQAARCLELYGASHAASLLSLDGRNGLCLFSAVDAEAVRSVSREAKVPLERAYKATIFAAGEEAEAGAGAEPEA